MTRLHETPLEALDDAVTLLENYAADIRNSAWTGTDLVQKGFCQGRLYQEGLERLRKALARFKTGRM